MLELPCGITIEASYGTENKNILILHLDKCESSFSGVELTEGFSEIGSADLAIERESIPKIVALLMQAYNKMPESKMLKFEHKACGSETRMLLKDVLRQGVPHCSSCGEPMEYVES